MEVKYKRSVVAHQYLKLWFWIDLAGTVEWDLLFSACERFCCMLPRVSR